MAEGGQGRVMAGIATARLTVEGLRHSVQAMLDMSARDMQETIRHEADRALAAFDFAGEVRQIVVRQMREAIEREIRGAVGSALWAEPLREMVSAAVTDAVRASLSGRA